MRRTFLLLVCGIATFFADGQNVGIGTTTPDATALLHLNLGTSTTQGLLVTGTSNPASTIPNLGGGSRLMFYPGKSAFRAGSITGTQWDNANVGLFSTAFGYTTTASGNSATAMGNSTIASGNFSTAMGSFTDASGDYSTTMGQFTTASGSFSNAMGYSSIALGSISTAIGNATTSSGTASIAMGQFTTASGFNSTAMGNGSVALGAVSTAMGNTTNASGGSSTAIGAYGLANADFSIAMGEDVTANSYISTSLGRQNDPIVGSTTTSWVLTEPLLIVGNGTSAADKKNAFAIAKNGNIYIDPSNKNDGTLTGNTLLFGTFNGTGEGISGKRTAGGNQWGLDFYTGSINRMSITNGGNVGLGISTPAFPLTFAQVLGDKFSLFGNAGGHYGMGIQSFLMQIYSDASNSDIAFGYGSSASFTENMRIRGNGNLGIGTTTPAARLHISSGDASVALFGPNPAGGRLYIGATSVNQTSTSAAQVIASDGNLHIDPAQGHNIYIGYYTADNVYLNPLGGNVGIGTLTAANPLSVSGNSLIIGDFFNNSSSNDVGVSGRCNTVAGAGLGVTGSGGGIGVSGEATLNGTGGRYGVYGNASNGTNNYGVLGVAAGGTTAYGIFGTASGSTSNYAGYFSGSTFSTGFYLGSDRKLKNDIQPLQNALSIIDQLKPSVYTFKTNEYKQMSLPEGLQYGLIADEVQEVVPGAVKKAVQPAEYENHDQWKGKKLNDEVEFKAVNYTEMIPILIGGMKEQQAIITNQQKQIDELKKALEKLVKQ